MDSHMADPNQPESEEEDSDDDSDDSTEEESHEDSSNSEDSDLLEREEIEFSDWRLKKVLSDWKMKNISHLMQCLIFCVNIGHLLQRLSHY